MKPFKAFVLEAKDPKTMTDDQLVKALNKVTQSLENFKGGPNTIRGEKLRDSWTDLKDEMIDRDYGKWKSWCKSKGFDKSANAIGFFA